MFRKKFSGRTGSFFIGRITDEAIFAIYWNRLLIAVFGFASAVSSASLTVNGTHAWTPLHYLLHHGRTRSLTTSKIEIQNAIETIPGRRI